MIWSLQILRFIAALLIVYVHAAETAVISAGSTGTIPYSVAGVGLAGVDIFFVLSGVVIAKTAPGLSPAQFAWRRLRRIMPLYLLCCIPALIVSLKTGLGWRELLATLFLWPATDVMTAPSLAIAWTLSFEMLFYSCAALILADRKWFYVLLAIYGSAFLLRQYGPPFQFIGNPLIVEFLFGVAIVYAPMRRIGIVGIPLGTVALIGAGLLGVAPTGDTTDFLVGQDNLRRVVVFGLPAALIVYGTMQIRAEAGLWTYLGDASYSLYLVHTFAVTPLLALWMAFPISADLIILIGMAASIILAWRVHELVEKPILRLLPSSLGKPASSGERPATQ